MLALVAGCGYATAATATTSPSASSTSASQTAYVACLREHGADVPTAKPTAKPTPAATGERRGTGAIPAAAREACASLRPHADQKNTAATAFDACMSAHGETIPTKQPDPTASPGQPAPPVSCTVSTPTTPRSPPR
jgi:hypothetical protein